MTLLKWLSVSDRLAKSYLDAQLAPLGINSSQYMYLLKVCDHPGILQDSFLEMFYVHPSNIVRMIAALEKKGFLTRVPWESDKRTCQLYPTEWALAIAGEIRAACGRTEAILTEGLTPDQQEALRQLLRRTGKQITKALHMERIGDESDA